jgi:hypothetical protein
VTVYGPNGDLAAARLPVYFGLAFLALLIVVFVVSQASKGGH